MADDPKKTSPDGTDPADASSDADLVHEETDWSAWGNLWQVPAIVLSFALIGGGLYLASQRGQQEEFAIVLEQVRSRIGSHDFDGAKDLLQMSLEPRVKDASQQELAYYHTLLGDWIAAMQETHNVSDPANNGHIIDNYRKAVELGFNLDPVRIERWAIAALAMGNVDDARDRLEELEIFALSDAGGAEARDRRNRVLRRVVEYSLRIEDLPYTETMAVLESYLRDPMLAPIDRAWGVARQARFRLEADEAYEAVEKLFIAMRRLEHGGDELDPAAWGELYMLLGRGYFDRGRIDHAEEHLIKALARFPHAVPPQGEAFLLLGRIQLARRDPAAAYERFDTVVRDFIDTPSYLPALHGRAQVSSVLGRHDESLADFRDLTKRLPDAGPRRDVTRESVATSLSDRHDAALTMGDLPLALRYVDLAEQLFDDSDVPAQVLRRIASTSREIADRSMVEGLTAVEHPRPRPEHVDPSVRFEASRAYERAAEYYLRHSRAVVGAAGDDLEWGTSLFLCGDSFDLAGLWDKAIEYLREYIQGRPADDPLRTQAVFRLAQAYEANEVFEDAVDAYSQVIRERPRSTFGTASHVPLARCYRSLGRDRDAEDVLVKLVDGRGGIVVTPDAPDYGDALIALGRLYYDTDKWPEAIERLDGADKAADRYPGDDRVDAIRFWLADSYRQHALEERERLANESRIAPQDRRERERRVREDLGTAGDLFSKVVDGYAAVEPASLEPAQRDQLRFASLYRADCAYELGDNDLAISLYDQAARRYRGHYTSMTALVQIVNIYEALGRTRDAAIAHQNALGRLRQLSDDAFDGALMDRAAWERWLENRPVGPTKISGAEAP